MKVSIENMICSIKVQGEPDLQRLSEKLPHSRFQPGFLQAVKMEWKDPECDVFILKDGTIRFNGLRSEKELATMVDSLMSTEAFRTEGLRLTSGIRTEEVIASHDFGSPLDPKTIYEEFRRDGIIYDPSELPGFILRLGKSGIEVLIFPEGKLVTRGAPTVADAVSSLQMVSSRLGEA